MLIDSHCHLNYLKLTDDYPDVGTIIQKAQNEGVEKLITIGVEWSELDTIQAIADTHDPVFFTAGIHPSEFEDVYPSMDALIAKATHDKCVGIGETGLDYHYNDAATIADQQRRFSEQIQIGRHLKKPVVIHTRAAKADTLAIMRNEQAQDCGGVMHCFTEDWEMAKQALDMGFYIAFSGIVTFKNAQSIQQVAQKVPADRLLVETDAPYLAPVPKRGKTNYPFYVPHTAAFLAELRGTSFQAIAQTTTDNAKRLFQLP